MKNAVIFSLLSVALAMPAQGSLLAKREPGDVYICTKADFKGDCITANFGIDGKCHEIPKPFRKNLGSMRPAKGALCRLTTTSSKATCDAHGDLFVEYPGQRDLYDLNGKNYGKEAHHIKCQKCTNCQGRSTGTATGEPKSKPHSEPKHKSKPKDKAKGQPNSGHREPDNSNSGHNEPDNSNSGHNEPDSSNSGHNEPGGSDSGDNKPDQNQDSGNDSSGNDNSGSDNEPGSQDDGDNDSNANDNAGEPAEDNPDDQNDNSDDSPTADDPSNN